MPSRFSLRSLLILMAVLAIGLGAIVGLKNIYDLGTEERAFNSVQVGDTEQKLVSVLQSHGIHYSTDTENGQILYSHDDGFVGIFFYYVAAGRVVNKAMD